MNDYEVPEAWEHRGERSFNVKGINKETGRRKSKEYEADDEAAARALAESDGILAEEVVELLGTPATDKQRRFAERRGITIPPGSTIGKASNLISEAIKKELISEARLNGINANDNITPEEVADLRWIGHGDVLASTYDHNLARIYGVRHTAYIGKNALFNLIYVHCMQKGDLELTAWFLCRVYIDMIGQKNDDMGIYINPAVRELAAELSLNEKFVKSLKRYTGHDLIVFGESCNGGSKKTFAYIEASRLLEEREGLPGIAHVSSAPALSQHTKKKGGAILKSVRYGTLGPSYFDGSGFDSHGELFVITNDGKAYAVCGSWGSWGDEGGMYTATEINCTNEGKSSSDIWKRLHKAKIGSMESDYFKRRRDLLAAIDDGSIVMKPKEDVKELLDALGVKFTVKVGKSVETEPTAAQKGCLGLLAALAVSGGVLASIIVARTGYSL